MGEQSGNDNTEHLDRKRARAARKAAFPTRRNIDAALRGNLPMSPEIAEYVGELDNELAHQRLPDSTVAKLALARKEVPEVIERGAAVHEASFTEAYLGNVAGMQAEVLVDLRIGADVPAAVRRRFKDGQIVVVGRGLDWVVDSAEEIDGRLLLSGHTVGCHPRPLAEI